MKSISKEDSRRRARAGAAVKAMQKHSVEKGLDRLTLDEINATINEVRKKRSRFPLSRE